MVPVSLTSRGKANWFGAEIVLRQWLEAAKVATRVALGRGWNLRFFWRISAFGVNDTNDTLARVEQSHGTLSDVRMWSLGR